MAVTRQTISDRSTSAILTLCGGPCLAESRHQPVFPHAPAVVLLGAASVHCVLLHAAGVPLDEVSAAWASRATQGLGHTADLTLVTYRLTSVPRPLAGQERTGSWCPRSTYS